MSADASVYSGLDVMITGTIASLHDEIQCVWKTVPAVIKSLKSTLLVIVCTSEWVSQFLINPFTCACEMCGENCPSEL